MSITLARVGNDRAGWFIQWATGFRSAMPDKETAELIARAVNHFEEMEEFIRLCSNQAVGDLSAHDYRIYIRDQAETLLQKLESGVQS